MDDQILKTNIEKHNLNEWFMNVCTVVTEVHEALYPREQVLQIEARDLAREMDENMDGVMGEVVEEVIDVHQSVEVDYVETS